MASKDRRTAVLESSTINGIDFVEVANAAQTSLRVHFLNALPLAYTLDNPPVTITGGESIPTVPVNPIDDSTDWGQDGSHLVLNLTVAAPGDFSNYTLTIIQKESLASGSYLLDPFFASAVFSFKALCPSDLDCQATAVVCPTPASDAPPIDYLSKDFLSFRQALLDFSALRYPEWQERSEADFGVMFLEALSALADDLSYTQDRIAAEASLQNATQRRSVVRMARLVDYWPTPALGATVLLQFDVQAGTSTMPAGLLVTAPGSDGTPIPFETGTSLAARQINPSTGLPQVPPPPVNSAWNRGAISPYWFDDSQQCLRAGATQMYVLGSGFNFYAGQSLLIETAPPTGTNLPIRQIVQLLNSGTETCDPLYSPPTNLTNPPPVLYCPGSPQGTAVTLIQWAADDALTTDRDLSATTLAGNLVVATQGQTQALESFYIPNPPVQPLDFTPAIVRTGPNDTPADPSLQYLYTLRYAPLTWLQPADPTQLPQPEIILTGTAPGAEAVQWEFAKWLLDAQAFDPAFTVDAARYLQIAGSLGNSPQYDYDGDAGDTLRFGDDVFGAVPEPATTFSALYRSGAGTVGNVAADSITSIDPDVAGKAGVLSVTNPMPAAGGADPQPIESIQRLAPQAFRAVQYRAVLPSDYAAAAETLPWVERAGTVFRWTGSWLTVFTTPDPIASEQATIDESEQLIELLNRYRMTGYESYVLAPDYVSIDLSIQVCALPTAFQGDVEEAVLTALGSAPGGFFAHVNFTFGQPLEKSALEAAIQGANGVAGVTCVRYRIRGRTLGFIPMSDTVTVGKDQIIRCDNDPSLPGNGSLQVIIEGGK
jgi:hypothetical protein